ncbi:Hypothetical predicted protein [Xyrichtys novacula]|uniref:Uncharacterized protein n=1 Tax=Xyrichtys novacula TaxID=13765 RepID=A0AAV1FRA4_XYRNO|nr:Hypothetical predicted protein [Xyrichtys novacula]
MTDQSEPLQTFSDTGQNRPGGSKPLSKVEKQLQDQSSELFEEEEGEEPHGI